MTKWLDSGEMTGRQALDLPPLWLLGFLVLAYVSGGLMPGWVVPFALAREIGAALVLAGVALMIWAVAAFRAHATSVIPHQMPRTLITSGPFAISRNPIYLGDAMVLAGAILWWGNWPALILIPAFVALIQRRFIAHEERRLKENFGTEFLKYAEKTRRWL